MAWSNPTFKANYYFTLLSSICTIINVSLSFIIKQHGNSTIYLHKDKYAMALTFTSWSDSNSRRHWMFLFPSPLVIQSIVLSFISNLNFLFYSP